MSVGMSRHVISTTISVRHFFWIYVYIVYILIADGGDSTVRSYPSYIHSLVCQRLGKYLGHISVWFYDVFLDQDDVMSEALVIVSDLYKILSQNNRYL